MKLRASLLCLFVAALGVAGACQEFVAPPEPEIEGLQSGVLTDVNAPLTLRFSKPIDPGTLRVKIVKLEFSQEGDLPDETQDPQPLQPIYSHDPDDGDKLGKSEMLDEDRALRITPLARFPVGTKLAVLVEPGLATKDGVTTNARRRLAFTYAFDCKGGRGSTVLRTGPYFFLLDVEQPLGTQIQLFGWMDVDPKTGLFRGQFTNADRNPDRTRCGGRCGAATVCRTLPAEDCVVPSLRAAGEDEFPDYIVNATPPTGYSFTATGCAEDQPDGTVAFRTAPADLIVQQPAVSIKGLEIIAAFAKAPDAVLHASGGGTADQVFLGQTPLGKAKGTLRGRSLTPEQTPPNVPHPPPQTDGGI
jgi:hypothetical protein